MWLIHAAMRRPVTSPLGEPEVDDSLAKLGVWRSMFALGAAQGEMDELLAVASR